MIIYKITNKINGKVYIGLTRKDLKNRIRQHKFRRKERPNHPLYNSMNKYGIDNFKFEAICSSLDIKYLGELEIFFIKLYNSTDMTKGYNLTEGGEMNNLSSETRKKLGEMCKIRWSIPENREKYTQAIRKAKKEYPKYTHSLETRKKISESGKGKQLVGANNPRSRKVQCIETGEIFDNHTHAKTKYKANIHKAAKTGRKGAGMHWIFLN